MFRMVTLGMLPLTVLSPLLIGCGFAAALAAYGSGRKHNAHKCKKKSFSHVAHRIGSIIHLIRSQRYTPPLISSIYRRDGVRSTRVESTTA